MLQGKGGRAMNKPAEYRENAALCLEAMRAAEVPEVKESLHALAQRWIDLAERVEHSGSRDAPGGGWISESSQRISDNPWQRF
jgi:hypothetical protein